MKGFHVAKDEELFPECITFVGVFLLKSFLKNGYLHLLLIDLVTEKDDFLVFIIDLHLRKPFEASSSGSAGESGREDGSFNDQANRGVDNLDIVCHNK